MFLVVWDISHPIQSIPSIHPSTYSTTVRHLSWTTLFIRQNHSSKWVIWQNLFCENHGDFPHINQFYLICSNNNIEFLRKYTAIISFNNVRLRMRVYKKKTLKTKKKYMLLPFVFSKRVFGSICWIYHQTACRHNHHIFLSIIGVITRFNSYFT